MNETETSEEMAKILRVLPAAIAKLNDEWYQVNNDEAFEAALEEVESLTKRGYKLASSVLESGKKKEI
jgi:hypothetical protein